MRKFLDSLQAPRKRNLLIHNSVIVYNSPRVRSDNAIPATENGRPILPTVFRLWSLLFYMVAASSPLNIAIFFSCLTVFLLFIVRRRIFNVVMKRTYAVNPLGSLLLRRQALFSSEMFIFMKMTKMNIIKGTRWRRRRRRRKV